MTKKLAVASLVEDFSLYPRNRVDDSHVNDLVRALQSGAELPPLIACAKTLRIVDGVHRRRAFLKAYGEDAKAQVELRKYATDAELFLDAVEFNSHHGRKLDRHDQTRIVLRLRELNVEDKVIALRLHIPEPTIQMLSLRIVTDSAGVSYPAKRGMKHLYGKEVTDEQISAMRSVRSAEVGRLCLELTRLIDAGMVDMDDDAIVQRLSALQASLSHLLQTVAA